MEPTDASIYESGPLHLNKDLMGNFDPSCPYDSILRNNRTDEELPQVGAFYIPCRLSESQKLFIGKLRGMPSLENLQEDSSDQE